MDFSKGGRRFSTKNAQTRLNIIEEAAHCPMETHPKLFGQCLLEFLKEFNISY